MKVITVKFYLSTSGQEPVKQWLLALPSIDRKAIGQDLQAVEFGWPMGMPLVRKMESRLWEVRSVLVMAA
jgi:phage-related protein